MAGILDGVLPYLYSQGDRLKRNVNGLLADPLGTLRQTAGQVGDNHNKLQALLSQAMPDPRQPFKVKNQNALMGAVDMAMNGPLGFAPVGMTAKIGDMPQPISGRSLFETDGLPNRGRDLIRGEAERLAGRLKELGFEPRLEHSGSAAGPSSYLQVWDPQTRSLVLGDIRLSGHSKGVKNSESVRNVSTSDFEALVSEALAARSARPAVPPDALPDPLTVAARRSAFDAFKEARDGGVEFTRYRAK